VIKVAKISPATKAGDHAVWGEGMGMASHAVDEDMVKSKESLFGRDRSEHLNFTTGLVAIQRGEYQRVMSCS
jgi:hypothetical protein